MPAPSRETREGVGRVRAGYALIAGGALLGVVLVAALVWALGWQQAQQAADIAQKLAATAAVVVGGFWVYDRFIRERVAESRLDLAVSAELVRPGGREEGALYVVATVGAQNVGSTKVDLDHDYCALTVSVHEPPAAEQPEDETADEASWKPLDRVWFVLQEQGAIEPGASFGDQVLLRLGPPAARDPVAVRLELVVQSEDGAYWSATSVATL